MAQIVVILRHCHADHDGLAADAAGPTAPRSLRASTGVSSRSAGKPRSPRTDSAEGVPPRGRRAHRPGTSSSTTSCRLGSVEPAPLPTSRGATPNLTPTARCASRPSRASTGSNRRPSRVGRAGLVPCSSSVLQSRASAGVDGGTSALTPLPHPHCEAGGMSKAKCVLKRSSADCPMLHTLIHTHTHRNATHVCEFRSVASHNGDLAARTAGNDEQGQSGSPLIDCQGRMRSTTNQIDCALKRPSAARRVLSTFGQGRLISERLSAGLDAVPPFCVVERCSAACRSGYPLLAGAARRSGYPLRFASPFAFPKRHTCQLRSANAQRGDTQASYTAIALGHCQKRRHSQACYMTTALGHCPKRRRTMMPNFFARPTPRQLPNCDKPQQPSRLADMVQHLLRQEVVLLGFRDEGAQRLSGMCWCAYGQRNKHGTFAVV